MIIGLTSRFHRVSHSLRSSVAYFSEPRDLAIGKLVFGGSNSSAFAWSAIFCDLLTSDNLGLRRDGRGTWLGNAETDALPDGSCEGARGKWLDRDSVPSR